MSAEAKAKAKEMAQEALAQRLKEINMTPTEAKTYTNVLEVRLFVTGIINGCV